jgi:flagellar assembly protein FliH
MLRERSSFPGGTNDLYEVIKTYSLGDLSDMEDNEPPEFITFFGKGPDARKEESEPKQPERDLENEARKVFEDAFAQGERAGREMGMKKVEPLTKRLNSYLAEIDSFRKSLGNRVEELSVELALAFAEALVCRQCDERRETVVDMAKRALELCEEKSNITIRVRREDAQYLAHEGMTHLKVIPDDGLKDRGFIIETDFGEIDGRISTQLEELRREFLNDRKGS